MAARKSELIITCNAKGVENVMNFLTERLKGIKQQLQTLNVYGSKNGWTDDMIKDFKELTDEASGIDSIMKKNTETMLKYGQVMQDLSNSKLRDVKKALQEGRNALNRMSENDPKRQKLIDDLAKIGREMEIIGGKRRSLAEVGNDLKNLSNVKFGTLQRDLESVRKEYEQLSDAERQGTKGQGLKNAERLLEAQIGVSQYGRAGSAAIVGTDRDKAIAMSSKDRQEALMQLQQEQQRLRNLYQATDGAKGFELVNKEALDRLHQVNLAVNNLTEAERKYAQAQRDANSAADKKKEISNIIDRLNKGEKVSLEELTEAHKHWQEQLKNAVGVNISQQDQQNIEILTNNIKLAEKSMKELRLQLDNIDVHKVAGNLKGSSIDELTAASKKGKEQFSYMKPSDSGYDQLKADLIAIDAELERVTPKWNELAQAEQALAKATDVASRAFSDDKVKLEELTEAQKTLEAQIKKMSGLALDPNEETELNRAKMMLDDVNKALDEIALKDIDFENLDATPTEKLQVALKNLEAQEKRLAGFQKSDAEEIARKKALIQKQLEKNKLAVMDVARAEQIAAHSGSHNVQELKQAYETLQQKLLTLNTNQKKDIARTKEDMAKLKSKIDEVTGSVKVQSTIWQTAVRNITAYVGVFGAFNFIKNKIMQAFESNKQLSDSLANIRKVSGLTSEEINTLYTDIAKIDTRNSVEQLNELAYAGAKLGVQEHGGVKALTGFVRAAEQVQMALGEDLGEEALPALAKLTEVMGLMDQYGVEQAMQKAASAIFMLSTTSTSTGANIVEFSKRLMGLANVSHITSAELVALGSASDSMGLMAEVSSTAFNKVFTKIQSNTAAIEKAVGVAKGSLKSLVDEGKTMEAIVTVFDKMRDMSMEEMQRRGIFTALGSDGARLNNVMTTMADRVDMLKKHLETSNKAFEEGEAVIAEYMIQNQTAAAYIERASNAFEKAFTNPEGVELVTELAKQWHELSLEMTNSTVMMGSMKAALWAVLEVVKGLIYVLPVLIQFLLFKGTFAAVTQLVTGFWNMSKAIWAAVTASKALTAAQKWNGLTTGLSVLAAMVMTLKAAFDQIDESAERARQKQQELDKTFVDSKDVIDKSTKSLDEYKAALDKSNLSQDERDKRLRAYIKNEYQPYLDFLGIEIEKVEDLADAYAQVTIAIKQKAAAEEKENYRSKVNGENRNNRIAAQAEAIREAKKAGFDIDKNFLDQNWEESSSELYKRITGGGANAYVTKRNLTFPKFGELMNALKSYQKIKGEETRIDRETDRMFNEEYKDLDLEHFSLEDFRKKQMEAQIEREKKRKNTVDLPPSKEELKEQRKAEAEHKQAIRKDLQDAKQESDAIIAKIEEWYRLQETVVTGFAADGKWTQQQAEMVNRELEAAKNEALANARLAISGRGTQTWEQTKESLRVMMFDTGEWSQELFQQMMDVSMAAIRQNLSRIDQEGGQYGITTSSLKDGLDKNAAGNRRKVQELRNKTTKEVEKMMLKYDFLEQAIKAFDDRLTSLGLLTESAEAAARRIQAGGQSEEQVQQQRDKGLRGAASKFIREGSKNLTVNYESEKDLSTWIGDFSRDESWADAFKEDFDKWRRDSKKYKGEMQAFFLSLVQMSDDYTEATKKAYEREKKLQDQRFQLAGYKTAEERTDTSLELRGKMQDAMGSGQNFWQQNGLQDTIATDPEVQRIQNRIYYRNLEYEDAKAHLDRMLALQQKELQAAKDSGASEQQLAEMQEQQRQARAGIEELTYQRQTELLTATADLAAKVSQEIASRVSTIQELSQPIADFAENAGQKLGDMMFNMESQSMTWNQIWKNMVLALAQATVKMGAQWLTQKIQQALFYKQMETAEAAHQALMTTIAISGATARMMGEAAINATRVTTNAATNAAEVGQEVSMATILTMLGISKGAAKIIGTLGWWGIPLIAVISSLLLGLLASALSTAGQESAATSGGAANRKVKLASGMLTYDEGNISTVVGDDGRVYRAREQRSLPEGVSMVTEPIATRVNGQQALVGERGPEIVIGRKTTRAIQMNRPDLLRDLALIDRGITTRKVRTFDEGNLSDLASAIQPAADQPQQQSGQIDPATAEALRMLPAAMRSFSQMMAAIQQQGIPAEIAMFDTSTRKGLRSQLRQADKMMAPYERK